MGIFFLSVANSRKNRNITLRVQYDVKWKSARHRAAEKQGWSQIEVAVVQRVIADRERFQFKPAFQHNWAGKLPSGKHNSGTLELLMSATPRTRRRSHRSEQPVGAHPGFQKLDVILQGFLIAVDGSDLGRTNKATSMKMAR